MAERLRLRASGWLLAGLVLAAPVGELIPAEAPGHPAIWELEGRSNRIYLLGAIHLLRPDDYPLAKIVDRVYADAESLVMEIDLDDLDPTQLMVTMINMGRLPENQSLEEVIGASLYREIGDRVNKLGFELDMLRRIKPWYAAITVLQMSLTQHGFSADQGVESYFVRQAERDNKEIFGLETVEEQLELFDQLPDAVQGAFLLATVEDALNIAPQLDSMVEAWKNGDTEYLEEELLGSLGDQPDLYQALVVKRNRAWTTQIIRLLDDRDDYLIVVGVLHLVGKDSVVQLLAEHGHRARRMP